MDQNCGADTLMKVMSWSIRDQIFQIASLIGPNTKQRVFAPHIFSSMAIVILIICNIIQPIRNLLNLIILSLISKLTFWKQKKKFFKDKHNNISEMDIIGCTKFSPILIFPLWEQHYVEEAQPQTHKIQNKKD